MHNLEDNSKSLNETLRKLYQKLRLSFPEYRAGFATYNGRWYVLLGGPKNWTNARTGCKSLGAGYDLVVISDINEQYFLEQEVVDGQSYWIGLTKEYVRNGTYTWVDWSDLDLGSTPQRAPWASFNPNNVSNARLLTKSYHI